MFNKPIRYTAFFLAFLFIVFAIFQYNDPDPFVWIPIYGIAAFISIGVALNRIVLPVLIVAMVLYLVGAVVMWPSSYEGLTLDMGYKIEIEEARESLGLLICGLAMAFYSFVAYKKKKDLRSF